jgi:hypothetical protein
LELLIAQIKAVEAERNTMLAKTNEANLAPAKTIAVNRARSTEDLAARDGQRAAIEVGLRFGVEPPTVPRVEVLPVA